MHLKKVARSKPAKQFSDLKEMQLSIFSGVLPNTLIQEENFCILFPYPFHNQTDSIQKNSLRIERLSTTSYKEKPLSAINIPKPQQRLTVNRPSRAAEKLPYKNQVLGGVDKSNMVRNVLRRNMSQFRYCYQRIYA